MSRSQPNKHDNELPQLGLGFDFGLLTFDLRHEGNFTKYGDHINFFNRKFNFDKAENRLIGTIGLLF